MCVCESVAGDYKGLGPGDHVFTGQTCVCVCGYRRENSSSSIHVNVAENASGGQRKGGQLEKKTQKRVKNSIQLKASDKSALESGGVFKSSVPV